MDLGEKGHLSIFKDGCGQRETGPTAGGAVEPGSDDCGFEIQHESGVSTDVCHGCS